MKQVVSRALYLELRVGNTYTRMYFLNVLSKCSPGILRIFVELLLKAINFIFLSKAVSAAYFEEIQLCSIL